MELIAAAILVVLVMFLVGYIAPAILIATIPGVISYQIFKMPKMHWAIRLVAFLFLMAGWIVGIRVLLAHYHLLGVEPGAAGTFLGNALTLTPLFSFPAIFLGGICGAQEKEEDEKARPLERRRGKRLAS